MQIIVLGMHRSGTSVVSRLLNLMGVYFAPDDFSRNRDILLGRQTGNQIVKLENKPHMIATIMRQVFFRRFS